MSGLQRTCPKCQELSPPNRYLCRACGAWLIEPRRIRGSELEQVLNDWYACDRPKRVVDPERHDDPDEWLPHYKLGGDTAPVPGPIPPREAA